MTNRIDYLMTMIEGLPVTTETETLQNIQELCEKAIYAEKWDNGKEMFKPLELLEYYTNHMRTHPCMTHLIRVTDARIKNLENNLMIALMELEKKNKELETLKQRNDIYNDSGKDFTK